MSFKDRIERHLRNSDSRALIENFFSLSALQLVGTLLPLLTLPYILRVIGFEKYGVVVFAASLIANGCFVIPILSSCVYHINHCPRSGSMEQKQREAKLNFERYNLMLDKTWEN